MIVGKSRDIYAQEHEVLAGLWISAEGIGFSRQCLSTCRVDKLVVDGHDICIKHFLTQICPQAFGDIIPHTVIIVCRPHALSQRKITGKIQHDTICILTLFNIRLVIDILLDPSLHTIIIPQNMDTVPCDFVPNLSIVQLGIRSDLFQLLYTIVAGEPGKKLLVDRMVSYKFFCTFVEYGIIGLIHVGNV